VIERKDAKDTAKEVTGEAVVGKSATDKHEGSKKPSSVEKPKQSSVEKSVSVEAKKAKKRAYALFLCSN